ncbi:hypothetical protein VP01_10421g1, partial [Puccinia sorghi]
SSSQQIYPDENPTRMSNIRLSCFLTTSKSPGSFTCRDESSHKPPLLTNLSEDNLGSHLQILEYLNSCKTGSHEEDGKICNNMTLKPLYQLHDMIIDMFITYSIIRGSAAANFESDLVSSLSQALVVLQKTQLEKDCSRHNYTPFCLYLVAGVRASALGFLSPVEHIFKKNQPQCEDLEPIWKRL